MALQRKIPLDNPDMDRLRAIGERVRARLDSDPTVYRIPVEGLEIFGVAAFFSEIECARLIEVVDGVAQPSQTYGDNADAGRTSYSGDVDPADPFIRMLQRRIDDLLGMDPHHGETIQGQRYSVGQEFRPHFDYFSKRHGLTGAETVRGGQRSWTAMVYLNNVESGGSTDFPQIPLSIPPQAGALLTWNNMQPDGRPNPKSLHAGRPVLQGTKYVLTKWYRARAWW